MYSSVSIDHIVFLSVIKANNVTYLITLGQQGRLNNANLVYLACIIALINTHLIYETLNKKMLSEFYVNKAVCL